MWRLRHSGGRRFSCTWGVDDASAETTLRRGASRLDAHDGVYRAGACAVSTLVVCNRGATTTTFRLAHAPGGAADTPGQYFVYDAPIAANTTVPFTLGVCLAATDVLRAYAGNANMTVIAWGEEQS